MTWFDDFADEMYGGSRPRLASHLADDFFHQLDLDAASTVIDLCAGRGHFALRMAQHVKRVVAIDFSANMIAYIQDRGSSRIQPILGNAVDIDLSHIQADVCTILWNSLGYQDPKTDSQLLKNAARGLRPGGTLIVEQRVAEDFPDGSDAYGVEERPTGFFYRERRIEGSRVFAHWSVKDKNGVILKSVEFSQYLYARDELAMLIRNAGFADRPPLKPPARDDQSAASSFFFATPRY